MIRLIVATGVILAAETATAGETYTWWGPLVNTGAIGGVLVWFMIRAEPRFRAIEASIDRVSRVLSLAIIALRSCDAVVREQAEEMVKELAKNEEKKT